MTQHNFNFTESGYTPGNLDFNFGPEETIIYSILKNSTNNFIAVWADFSAGKNNGKMYIASEGYLNIVDLSTNKVIDWYSQTQKGRTNETLTSSDIVDLNVV